MDVLLSKELIKDRNIELGREITKVYSGKVSEQAPLLCIGILRGSFVFMADLIREINLPTEVDFLECSSYEGTESSGKVKIHKDLREDIKGREVLVVEDIVDTGITMHALRGVLEKRSPSSLSLASFLFKPSRVKKKVEIKFLGFEIEDKFVVGYGLDFNGAHRNLPELRVMGT